MPFVPRSISREWDINAPLSLVWEAVAHTDKLNRAIGLPPIQMGAFDGEELAREVTARLYGLLAIRWIEYPFEWVRERGYTVQRDFMTGPLLRFRGGVELIPVERGTRVRIHAELTPRNLLGRVAIPFIGRDTLRKSWAYFHKVIAQRVQADEATSSQAASTPSSLPAAPSPAAKRTDLTLLKRRAAALEELISLDQRVVAELIRHLAEAGDDEVVRMRPSVLAVRWRATRSETLRVFLYATRAGLLDLAWELMCPNCRVPKVEAATLSLVTKLFHCETCGIDYEANLDRYVELRFHVNPGIRAAKAQAQVYCFGGPYSAPHALVQHLLKPGEVREVAATLEDEAHRVRVLRLNRSTLLLPGTRAEPAGARSPGATLVEYRDGGWSSPDAVFTPGPVRLRWANRSSKTIGIVLEWLRWDDQAVTAAEVTALQEFRDLFGSEVLGPGQDIGIESVTILFSDLKDSTRLYELAGDAPAYGHVRQHFDFLKERVARCRGAVVKTIGDSVMAVFHLPEDAVQCCVEIQRDVGPFNESWPSRQALTVKLGVHHGPAIAINANGRLDYFGRTVNVAARIARESEGGDVVLAKALLEDPRVHTVLERDKASVAAEWTSTLRGVTEPLTLCRVKL
jgi:class 3 adenylate cyclase